MVMVSMKPSTKIVSSLSLVRGSDLMVKPISACSKNLLHLRKFSTILIYVFENFSYNYVFENFMHIVIMSVKPSTKIVKSGPPGTGVPRKSFSLLALICTYVYCIVYYQEPYDS